jgi:acyl-coenzyme A thioesterase PaaI-like protein
MNASVTELPFNSFLGIKIALEKDKILTLPSGGQYLNHLGTVHASAQLALAEAASGEFLLRALGSADNLVPVVRRLESKFRKPANGSISASISTTHETIEQTLRELTEKGRSIVPVDVQLHDESGAHTLSATIEWFITRIAQTPPSEPTPATNVA